ncbi:MAG TPA: DinB family protein [Ferruginibacter sp.]|nr:DinB family protein [Ferruginibacter sp.]HRE63721.1 DinB family protein [Ferruginibacter sp.]
MDTIQQLKDELTQEYQTTKKFISIFPDGKNDYAPHEKSMKLMPLATHIVEVFAWPETILNTEVLDFGKDEYKPTILNNRQELLGKLEADYETGMAAIAKIDEDKLNGTWALAHNGHQLAKWSKYGAIRHSLNQITHHRAQLGVYYRLLEIALPGSYGPSADDSNF